MSEAARGPLLTAGVHAALLAARDRGASMLECSLDLNYSTTVVDVSADSWQWLGRGFPYPEACKARTVYYWTAGGFQPVARFSGALIKLVPTAWGPPVFEIDGIKMLVSAQVSPYVDAERKVQLVQPRGKAILDTCGGLGYFALWCLRGHAARVQSFEKSREVIWLRSINPWSPERDAAAARTLTLANADITEEIVSLPPASFDAVLHDPPRFGIAGELYSQAFYDQLARVLRRRGRLFHYTGAPQRASHGRHLGEEVARRLRRSGFATEFTADGVLATRQAVRPAR